MIRSIKQVLSLNLGGRFMKKEWKLWPNGYNYRYSKMIWGIGFDLFIIAFVFLSIHKDTKFYINEKPVTFTEFLVPVGAILLVGIIIAASGVVKNIGVYKARKELEFLKANFKCYEGTISSIERIQVNEIVKSQADNIHNKYTHVLNRAVVDFMDEDGRKRVVNSEEYSESLSAFLKDNKAKVYVSKNGNNRIVDDLSWRQSSHDEYINIPGEEMKGITKKIYYILARWRNKIEVVTLTVVFASILLIVINQSLR